MVVKDKRKVVEGYFNQEGNLKTSNNSISTSERGKTLYSYNTPIATYSEKEGKHYLNADKYSSTTSSQQNIFRAEARSRGAMFEEVDEDTLRSKARND